MSVDYCPCGHEEDNDQHACPVTQERLRATLSLAEEGLANYAQELADLRQAYDYHKGNAERLKASNETLSQQRDHWLNVARNKDAQVERLKAALERIGHHGDEENEWDAVERYDAVRTWAMEALGEFPDGLRFHRKRLKPILDPLPVTLYSMRHGQKHFRTTAAVTQAPQETRPKAP